MADEIVLLAVQVLTPVLMVLASYAALRLSQRLGMEKHKAVDELLKQVVDDGVNYAEQWAKKIQATEAGKPKSEDKLSVAVGFVVDMAEMYNLPKMSGDRLAKLVEA